MSAYDESLLKDTQVTRAERQEGYNVDLLNEKPPSRAQSPPAPVHARISVQQSPINNRTNDEEFPPIPVNNIEKNRPFWRTTKGIALMAVVAVIVLGAIIGGAVGGTVSHRGKANGQFPPTGSGGGQAASDSGSPASSTTAPSSTTAGALQNLTSTPSTTTASSGDNGGNPAAAPTTQPVGGTVRTQPTGAIPVGANGLRVGTMHGGDGGIGRGHTEEAAHGHEKKALQGHAKKAEQDHSKKAELPHEKKDEQARR